MTLPKSLQSKRDAAAELVCYKKDQVEIGKIMYDQCFKDMMESEELKSIRQRLDGLSEAINCIAKAHDNLRGVPYNKWEVEKFLDITKDKFDAWVKGE